MISSSLSLQLLANDRQSRLTGAQGAKSDGEMKRGPPHFMYVGQGEDVRMIAAKISIYIYTQ